MGCLGGGGDSGSGVLGQYGGNLGQYGASLGQQQQQQPLDLPRLVQGLTWHSSGALGSGAGDGNGRIGTAVGDGRSVGRVAQDGDEEVPSPPPLQIEGISRSGRVRRAVQRN